MKKRILAAAMLTILVIILGACGDSSHMGSNMPIEDSEQATAPDEKEGDDEIEAESQLPTNESDQIAVPSEKDEAQQIQEVPTAADPMNMKLGECGLVGNTYIGLAYAKRGAHTTMALGVEEDITPGYEVLFAFFELYNGSDYVTCDFSNGDITCYCDSLQVSAVESNFFFKEDGITEYPSYELDENAQAFAVVNFEVPKGWKEVTLFLGSELAWKLTTDEVSDAAFNHQSIFDVKNEYTAANVGDVIYSNDSSITFDGAQEYFPESDSLGRSYVVYKFTVTNTSMSELDYSLVGYNMRGYQNNYLLNEAVYLLDDKIDGYLNVFDVDTIQAGMSCKLYVAFEIEELSENYRMVYDVGYITNEELGSFYVNNI